MNLRKPITNSAGPGRQLMLAGEDGMVLSREQRRSGCCAWVQSMSFGGLLFFIGVTRTWSDWRFANPINAVILVGLALGALLMLSPYVWVEFSRRRDASSTAL
jgi:hypothetical protein